MTLLFPLYLLRILVSCLWDFWRCILARRKAVLRPTPGRNSTGQRKHWTFWSRPRSFSWSHLWGCLQLKGPLRAVQTESRGHAFVLLHGLAVSSGRAAPFSEGQILERDLAVNCWPSTGSEGSSFPPIPPSWRQIWMEESAYLLHSRALAEGIDSNELLNFQLILTILCNLILIVKMVKTVLSLKCM